MTVIIIAQPHDQDAWRRPIQALVPEIEILTWPEIGDPAAVEVAIVHKAEAGALGGFPNLRALIGMWAGVEHILERADLPDVPIARMVDPLIARDIGHYVVLHTLRHFRSMPQILANQRAHKWNHIAPPPADFSVGIMGLGAIGMAAAGMLIDLGFKVRAWTRTPKSAGGDIAYFTGRDGLEGFLAEAQVCACTLPLTPETQGIINATTLALLPPGAHLINAGRGGHVVEPDLLAALDAGSLSGATLDVFSEEPPAGDSPFWDHPNVTMTPHNAADPRPESVAPAVADNIRRALAGRQMLNLVDRQRGY
ncbi:MAG: glyoxylate/hydroxypyruvate reductase A [Proteobacteria bacterium]|nr:glyoxylate/hydroxypyruvate reductase A [Pseudomonadota bacterium]